MPAGFDPYHKWLGISPKDQPPDHYRLLGIDRFESDVDVIQSAADQRMAHIRSFRVGEHSRLTQEILNEIAAAKVCLLRPDARRRANHGPARVSDGFRVVDVDSEAERVYEHHRARLRELGVLGRRDYHFRHLQAPTAQSKHFFQKLLRGDCPSCIDFSSTCPSSTQPISLTVWCWKADANEWDAFIERHDAPDYRERFMHEAAGDSSDSVTGRRSLLLARRGDTHEKLGPRQACAWHPLDPPAGPGQELPPAGRSVYWRASREGRVMGQETQKPRPTARL